MQRVGHGLCGGFSPPRFWNALSLTCWHEVAPRIEHKGVVYRYSGRAEVPRSLDDRDVGYALADMATTVWPRAHDVGAHRVFASTFDFHGARCARFDCPRAIGDELAPAPGHGSTGLSWSEGPGKGVSARGEAFFDPAWALSRRLRFGAPFSTEYRYNPYLGVGSAAPPMAAR
jgi:hypothetical protein